jgi:lipocalin
VWAEERGEVVEGVDLRQFEGTWYEIARLPNKHQKGMVEVTSTLKRTKTVNMC